MYEVIPIVLQNVNHNSDYSTRDISPTHVCIFVRGNAIKRPKDTHAATDKNLRFTVLNMLFIGQIYDFTEYVNSIYKI